jgi:diguanylate cyclase (GGDEF)-like protein
MRQRPFAECARGPRCGTVYCNLNRLCFTMPLLAQLDLPTLLWVALTTNGVLALSVLYVAGRPWTDDGLAAWGWGLALHALSYPTIALRTSDWPVLSLLGHDLLVSGSLALHGLAVWQFQRHRSPPLHKALLWGPVLATVAAALVFSRDHGLRTAVQIPILAGQGLLLIWLAWAPWSKATRERGRVLLSLGAVALLMLVLVHGIGLWMQSRWDDLFLVPASHQALTCLAGLVIALLGTTGYALMRQEHTVQLLHTQSRLDVLTGIPNRRALIEQLERDLSLAARQSTPLSLLIIDIDHFKQVNDLQGHVAGDAVLRHVARLIARRVRRYDGLGRYGGEEFLVGLPATDAVGARVVAEAIRRAVESSPLEIEGRSILVTVSVGVHTRVPKGPPTELTDMIAEADRAMYRAKQAGRNRIDASA